MKIAVTADERPEKRSYLYYSNWVSDLHPRWFQFFFGGIVFMFKYPVAAQASVPETVVRGPKPTAILMAIH